MTHQCALNVRLKWSRSLDKKGLSRECLLALIGCICGSQSIYNSLLFQSYLRRHVFTFIFLAKTTDMWSSLQDLPLSQTNPEARTDLDCVSVWSTSLRQTCAAIAKGNHVTLERVGLKEPISICLQANAYFFCNRILI